ncbi:hypothetical protein VE04_09463 [Pseudogymnoascus sp. 24MN13]|nr:hypothetical protein VE04_09463 [Pseudogymnoascus sp. 24MN13]
MGVILSLFHTVRNRNRSSQPPPAPAVPETHELDTLHASPTSAPPTATNPAPTPTSPRLRCAVIALTGYRSSFTGRKSFADLIGSPDGREIEILDISQWDERGEYKSIVDAIRDATSGGDVRVYRVPRGATRVEYWVVGVEEGEEGRLVGAKALSVES